ncbi:hypothetical protein ACJ72_08858, partial [Emergomyces africanus]
KHNKKHIETLKKKNKNREKDKNKKSDKKENFLRNQSDHEFFAEVSSDINELIKHQPSYD